MVATAHDAIMQLRSINIMDKESVMKYAIMKTKILCALDSASDDLDAASAMDTMRKAASRMSRLEWDSCYDIIGGRDSVEFHGQTPPEVCHHVVASRRIIARWTPRVSLSCIPVLSQRALILTASKRSRR